MARKANQSAAPNWRSARKPRYCALGGAGRWEDGPAWKGAARWKDSEWIDACWQTHCRTILIINEFQTERDDLQGLVEREHYRALTARSGSEGLALIECEPADLIILDRLLPDMDGAEFCRRVRSDRRLDLTPIIMISGEAGHENARMGADADAFIARPFHPEALSARIGSLLRQKAVAHWIEESETVLLSLAQTVELRDQNTAGHCDRLAALSVAMGMAMDLPSSHLIALHRGAYLHDIGKIAVPDAVLFKNGPLNEEEWAIMKTHPVKGETICRPMKSLNPVLPIIRSHHERWDGSGYPDGLAGVNIPLLARVLQLADIYDALTADRCYKAAMSSTNALRIMQEETDRGWHDSELLRIFLRLPHNSVREAAERNSGHSQDQTVMRQSLENLRSSLLHG